MTDLREHRVAVFGGSSGIGLSAALLAREAGADVTIISRSRERLDRAADVLDAARTVALDIRDPRSVTTFFESHEAFDHVVVTAAELQNGPLRAMPLGTAYDALDSKFRGAMHVAHAARIASSGSLTFVSGMLGTRPSGQATILSAINAALDALAKALATEMAPVRVNCVSPGRIDSPWWDFLPTKDREDLLGRTAATLPVKRIGRPEDVAALILHTMQNSFLTGAVLNIDGGGAVL